MEGPGAPKECPPTRSVPRRPVRGAVPRVQEGIRAWKDTLSPTVQPDLARNRQKVKIPFVNKIELFDCEIRVHGI